MAINSDGSLRESAKGMHQNHAGATSPQSMTSAGALTLDGNFKGHALSVEVMNALSDVANTAASTRALGVIGIGQGGQNKNPVSARNTGPSSSQNPGLDGRGAQSDQSYALQRFEDQKLWDGPWFPGATQIREAERVVTDESEARSML